MDGFFFLILNDIINPAVALLVISGKNVLVLLSVLWQMLFFMAPDALEIED